MNKAKIKIYLKMKEHPKDISIRENIDDDSKR